MTDETCPIHGKFLNSAGECPDCLAEAEAPKASASPAKAADPGSTRGPRPNRHDGAGDKAKPVDSPEPEVTQKDAETAREPAKPETVREAASAERKPDPPKASSATTAAAAPPPSSTRGTRTERPVQRRTPAEQLAQLKARIDAGRKLVVVCGFGTAGKTWMLERLREQLPSALGRKASVAWDTQAPSPTRLEVLTRRRAINRTFELFFHNVDFHADASENFTIIDVVGEQFEDLTSGNYASSLATIGALLYADMIVLALPADAVLIGRKLCDLFSEDEEHPVFGGENLIMDSAAMEELNRQEIERTKRIDLLTAVARKNRSAEQIAELEQLQRERAEYQLLIRPANLANEYADIELFGQHMTAALKVVAFAADLARQGQLNLFEPDFNPAVLSGTDLYQGPVQLAKPTYIALTKADTVLPLLEPKGGRPAGFPPDHSDWPNWPERELIRKTMAETGWIERSSHFFYEPRLAMADAYVNLLNGLNNHLDVSRIDWASADWNARGWDRQLGANNPSLGINWLSDWIRSALRGTLDRDIDPVSLARVETLGQAAIDYLGAK